MSLQSDKIAGDLIDGLFFLNPEKEPRFRLHILVAIVLVGALVQGLVFLTHLGLAIHLSAFTLTYALGIVYCFRPTIWLMRHLKNARQ